MSKSILLKPPGRKLPEVPSDAKEQLISSATFDTRKDEQKNTAKPRRVAKSITLEGDSLDTLEQLVELTNLSERTILGLLQTQALNLMKPKIEAAIKQGFAPNIKID